LPPAAGLRMLEQLWGGKGDPGEPEKRSNSEPEGEGNGELGTWDPVPWEPIFWNLKYDSLLEKGTCFPMP
jgi:hypothetical protein